MTIRDERPLLSVIVPMFNMEAFIRDCLASLAGQLPQNDLEVVVVDDASTDASAQIVAEFVIDFPEVRIKLVQHSKNLGLGEARRTGLRGCTGEYVWCLDADDLAANGLAALAKELRTLPLGAILLFRNYGLVDAVGNDTGRIRSGIRGTVRELNAREYVRRFLRGEASPNVTNKVFRRNLLIIEDFSPRRIWEDNPTLIAIMSKAQCVVVSELNIYKIRERPASIMRSGMQLASKRSDLVQEVKIEIEGRFGPNEYPREIPYYLLNAGVLEDILTVASREPQLKVAIRQAFQLSRGIEWRAVGSALGIRKWRTATLAIAAKVAPRLTILLLRAIMRTGKWRQ